MRPPQYLLDKLLNGDFQSMEGLIEAIEADPVPEEHKTAVDAYLQRVKDCKFVMDNQLTPGLGDQQESAP